MVSEPLQGLEHRVRPHGATPWVALGSIAVFWGAGGGAEPLALLAAACGGAMALAAFWVRLAPLPRVLCPAPVRTRAGARALLKLQLEHPGGRWPARDLQVQLHGAASPVEGILSEIAAGETATLTLEPRFRERGVVQELPLRITTRYPLGLFTRTWSLAVAVDIRVAPKRLPLTWRDPAHNPGGLAQAQRQASRDGEFWALREHRTGEGLRHVHWKLSAKRGRRLVRELSQEDPRPLRIWLSTYTATATGTRARHHRAPFEQAVSLAASLITLGLQQGRAVGLTVVGATSTVLPARTGPRHGRRCVDALIDVRASQGELSVLHPSTDEQHVLVGAGVGAAPVPVLDVLEPELADRLRKSAQQPSGSNRVQRSPRIEVVL